MQTSNKPEARIKGDDLLIFTNVVRILVSQEETNGQYAVFEDNVPPLGGPPPHSHPDEEIFYIMKGEFEFVLNDLSNPFRVEAGSVVHIPSNAIHAFKNVGKSTGKIIAIITPGNLEMFFREIGKPLNEPSEYPDLNIPPDLAKLDVGKAFVIAPEYGVKFYLPEIAN
ncbi:MAG: cupin domain-containing protein [Cyclobacteriaceae bacterium]